MITVLHVLVPEPPGEVGGADLHVLDLARHQQARGLRPLILERGSGEYSDRARAADLDVVSLTGLTRRAALRVAHGIFVEHQPDLVHSHGYDANYWTAALRVRHRGTWRAAPTVFTQHGIVADTLWHKVKTGLDAICSRSADALILSCEAQLARVRRWCPRTLLAVIPNGVDPFDVPDRKACRAALARDHGVPPTRRLIGYVGRLSAEKRVDRVLAVARHVCQVDPSVHVVITGSGPEQQALRKLARTLGVEDRTTFTGFLRDPAMVFGALDVLLLLSDTEGTPRVVIEAMLAGVPVVASREGGVPGLLDEGRAGWLVKRGDTNTAAEAVLEALSDPSDRISAAQTRARENNTIDTMGDRITAFYTTVLNRKMPTGMHRSYLDRRVERR